MSTSRSQAEIDFENASDEDIINPKGATRPRAGQEELPNGLLVEAVLRGEQRQRHRSSPSCRTNSPPSALSYSERRRRVSPALESLRDPSHADNEEPVARRAAESLGVQLHPVTMRGPADLDRALDAATQSNIDSIYVVSSRHTAANAGRIVEFATKAILNNNCYDFDGSRGLIV